MTTRRKSQTTSADDMPSGYILKPSIYDIPNIVHLYKWKGNPKKYARNLFNGFNELRHANAVSVELTGEEANEDSPGFHVKVNQQVFDTTHMPDSTAAMMRWVMAQSWCTVNNAVGTSQTVIPAETRQTVIPAESRQAMIPAETSQAVIPAETRQTVIPAETSQAVIPAETSQVPAAVETNQAINAGSCVDKLAVTKTAGIITQIEQAVVQKKEAELRAVAAELRAAEAKAKISEIEAARLEKAVSDQEVLDRAALNTKQVLPTHPVLQFDTPQADLLLKLFASKITETEASAGCKRKREESGNGAPLESSGSKAPIESSGSKAPIESSSSSLKAPLESSGASLKAATDNKSEGTNPEAERKAKVQRTTDSFLSAQSIIDAVEPSMQSFIEATEPLNRAISAFAASFFRMQPGP